MEIIGRERLWSVTSQGEVVERECFEIREDEACPVLDYLDLAKKIATLQFKNPNYIMLFRGQHKDYKRHLTGNRTISSLSPSLFRKINNRNPSASQLRRKFDTLRDAENALMEGYHQRVSLELIERLQRHKILRWTILQHYEVCDTPLLDVTQSLRIAASFASNKTKSEAYVFVLGVPNLSGSVTASAEAGIQIVRLASVCPPNALRPHIQEGYLLGEYPEMSDFDQKRNYGHFEIDFGRRLVAKFCFDPNEFWHARDPFPMITHEALYPDEDDELFKLTQSVKNSLNE